MGVYRWGGGKSTRAGFGLLTPIAALKGLRQEIPGPPARPGDALPEAGPRGWGEPRGQAGRTAAAKSTHRIAMTTLIENSSSYTEAAPRTGAAEGSLRA